MWHLIHSTVPSIQVQGKGNLIFTILQSNTALGSALLEGTLISLKGRVCKEIIYSYPLGCIHLGELRDCYTGES